jgi:hypothetical protein
MPSFALVFNGYFKDSENFKKTVHLISDALADAGVANKHW